MQEGANTVWKWVLTAFALSALLYVLFGGEPQKREDERLLAELRTLAALYAELPEKSAVRKHLAGQAQLEVVWARDDGAAVMSSQAPISYQEFFDFPEVLAAKGVGEGVAYRDGKVFLALKTSWGIVRVGRIIETRQKPLMQTPWGLYGLTLLLTLILLGGAGVLNRRRFARIADKCNEYLKDTDFVVRSRLDLGLEKLSKHYAKAYWDHDIYRRNARILFDAIPSGIVVLNLDGRVDRMNASAMMLLKSTSSQVRGRSLEELCTAAGVLRFLRDSLKRPDRSIQDVAIYSDGKESIVRLTLNSVTRAKHPQRLLIIDDITAEKQRQRERQDYIANASHELRTPLTVVKGYLYTLLEGAPSGSTEHRFLERMDAQVDRLVRLTEDLLELAQDQEASRKVEVSELRLGNELGILVDMFRDLAEKKGVHLETEFHAKLRIFARRAAFHEVMSNLLDNAIKYTPKGGQVQVQLRAVGHEARIVVSDTGIGIPAPELKRIFERFYRVNRAGGDIEGFGLGLSIVELHVRELGGRIEVESEVGRGTRFTLYFPTIDDGL